MMLPFGVLKGVPKNKVCDCYIVHSVLSLSLSLPLSLSISRSFSLFLSLSPSLSPSFSFSLSLFLSAVSNRISLFLQLDYFRPLFADNLIPLRQLAADVLEALFAQCRRNLSAELTDTTRTFPFLCRFFSTLFPLDPSLKFGLTHRAWNIVKSSHRKDWAESAICSFKFQLTDCAVTG